MIYPIIYPATRNLGSWSPLNQHYFDGSENFHKALMHKFMMEKVENQTPLWYEYRCYWLQLVKCKFFLSVCTFKNLETMVAVLRSLSFLRPRQNCRYFPDDIFKRIFLNENVLISIKISLKFVPMGSISNIPTLVQIMARRRPGDKPLSEATVVSLLTHICVTRPQCVNAE